MIYKRINNFLIDVDGSYIICTETGVVQHFDFKNMTSAKITANSKTPHPVRYDEDAREVVKWQNRSWKSFGKEKDAVLFLFNTQVEKQLLD